MAALKPELTDVSMDELLKMTLSATHIPSNIKVSITVEEGFPGLIVDSAMMKRTFTNLIVNAIQVMADGGGLTISASKREEEALVIF